jgi:hypothetical protein
MDQAFDSVLIGEVVATFDGIEDVCFQRVAALAIKDRAGAPLGAN